MAMRLVPGLYMLGSMNYKKTKSFKKAITKTCHTLYFVCYMMIYQSIQKNIKTIKPGQYDVLYTLNDKLYKIRIHNHRGPSTQKILQIVDENSLDVTLDLKEYCGPMEDFHGIPYTPSVLGFKELTFNLANGISLTFEENEKIYL